MDLRTEILQQPRGILVTLRKQTGLSKMTIHRAVHGIRCGKKAAKKIAAAFGCPDRWQEIRIDPEGDEGGPVPFQSVHSELPEPLKAGA